MPAAFLWLTPFIATLFNFVEGFAVQWLRRLSACGVSMADAVSEFLWLTPFLSFYGLRRLSLRRLNGFTVSKFYVVVMRKKYINICSSENYVYFCEIVMAITVMLFTKK